MSLAKRLELARPAQEHYMLPGDTSGIARRRAELPGHYFHPRSVRSLEGTAPRSGILGNAPLTREHHIGIYRRQVYGRWLTDGPQGDQACVHCYDANHVCVTPEAQSARPRTESLTRPRALVGIQGNYRVQWHPAQGAAPRTPALSSAAIVPVRLPATPIARAPLPQRAEAAGCGRALQSAYPLRAPRGHLPAWAARH